MSGDTAATINNLIAKEFLFRTGIVSILVSSIIFVYLVMVLYRLLKQVNERQAKLMVAFVIMQIPISFLAEIFHVSALMIAKGELLKSADPTQRQDFAMLFLKTYNYSITILQIFWGLWLIPFGQLVYKSDFIPRILGVLLIIGGLGYIISSLTFLLFPNYHSSVTQFTIVFSGIGELSMILWLLIKGVRVKQVR